MEVISEIYLGETGKLQAPKTADQIWDTNVRLRAFQKEYMDYWNSTATMTSSGKPVVAVLSPVSAVAAYRFDKTNPSGMSPCCCVSNAILPG
jgi:amidase